MLYTICIKVFLLSHRFNLGPFILRISIEIKQSFARSAFLPSYVELKPKFVHSHCDSCKLTLRGNQCSLGSITIEIKIKGIGS